jgi:hypothetical protein
MYMSIMSMSCGRRATAHRRPHCCMIWGVWLLSHQRRHLVHMLVGHTATLRHVPDLLETLPAGAILGTFSAAPIVV